MNVVKVWDDFGTNSIGISLGDISGICFFRMFSVDACVRIYLVLTRGVRVCEARTHIVVEYIDIVLGC